MELLNANCYVYCHFREDTGVFFYIGIGSYQKKHKYGRMNSTYGRNIYWKRIVSKADGKYGKQILYDKLTKEEACLKEIELIKKYGEDDGKGGLWVKMHNEVKNEEGSVIGKVLNPNYLEFDKEYGTFDINIQDGTINHPKEDVKTD